MLIHLISFLGWILSKFDPERSEEDSEFENQEGEVTSSSERQRRDGNSDAPATTASDVDLRHQRPNLNFLSDREKQELKRAGDELYRAADAGDHTRCQSLLARGADVHHIGDPERNYTPLHRASLNGRTSVVKLLIESGANLECRSKLGSTPLHLAAQEGHLAIARLLVNSGARTDATKRDGGMPIHQAAKNNRHQILTYLVTEAGVSVNVVSTATAILGK